MLLRIPQTLWPSCVPTTTPHRPNQSTVSFAGKLVMLTMGMCSYLNRWWLFSLGCVRVFFWWLLCTQKSGNSENCDNSCASNDIERQISRLFTVYSLCYELFMTGMLMLQSEIIYSTFRLRDVTVQLRY